MQLLIGILCERCPQLGLFTFLQKQENAGNFCLAFCFLLHATCFVPGDDFSAYSFKWHRVNFFLCLFNKIQPSNLNSFGNIVSH